MRRTIVASMPPTIAPTLFLWCCVAPCVVEAIPDPSLAVGMVSGKEPVGMTSVPTLVVNRVSTTTEPEMVSVVSYWKIELEMTIELRPAFEEDGPPGGLVIEVVLPEP
jgi:hypothetical protein